MSVIVADSLLNGHGAPDNPGAAGPDGSQGSAAVVAQAHINGMGTDPAQAQQAPQLPQQPGNNGLALGQRSAPSETTRPRDTRMVELLLKAQGVTAYESRVPQMLVDFAYRHASGVLSDAQQLSGDPYTTHAGARPSASAGASFHNPAPGDAHVTANAVSLAIASRLAYQFRGGVGAVSARGARLDGGNTSREFMMELARERNKTVLPRVAQNEWGIRLPGERFVLTGTSWGLRDQFDGAGDDDDDDDFDDDDLDDEYAQHNEGLKAQSDDEDERDKDAMLGVEMTNDVAEAEDNGDEVEGGTIEDVFGTDAMDEDRKEALS